MTFVFPPHHELSVCTTKFLSTAAQWGWMDECLHDICTGVNAIYRAGLWELTQIWFYNYDIKCHLGNDGSLIFRQHLLVTSIQEISELLHRSRYMSYLTSQNNAAATNWNEWKGKGSWNAAGSHSAMICWAKGQIQSLLDWQGCRDTWVLNMLVSVFSKHIKTPKEREKSLTKSMPGTNGSIYIRKWSPKYHTRSVYCNILYIYYYIYYTILNPSISCFTRDLTLPPLPCTKMHQFIPLYITRWTYSCVYAACSFDLSMVMASSSIRSPTVPFSVRYSLGFVKAFILLTITLKGSATPALG